jgi:hypothetical protein
VGASSVLNTRELFQPIALWSLCSPVFQVKEDTPITVHQTGGAAGPQQQQQHPLVAEIYGAMGEQGGSSQQRQRAALQSLQQHAVSHQLPAWTVDPATLNTLYASERPATCVRASLEALQQQQASAELELLQYHVYCSLGGSTGTDTSGTPGTASSPPLALSRVLSKGAHVLTQTAASSGCKVPVWALLMADWVVLNATQPGVRAPELLPLAQAVHAAAGEGGSSTRAPPPPREPFPFTSLLAGANAAGAAAANGGNSSSSKAEVGITPAPTALDSASTAQVRLSLQQGVQAAGGDGAEETVSVSRCGASLVMCGGDGWAHPPWHCLACARK